MAGERDGPKARWDKYGSAHDAGVLTLNPTTFIVPPSSPWPRSVFILAVVHVPPPLFPSRVQSRTCPQAARRSLEAMLHTLKKVHQ